MFHVLILCTLPWFSCSANSREKYDTFWPTSTWIVVYVKYPKILCHYQARRSEAKHLIRFFPNFYLFFKDHFFISSHKTEKKFLNPGRVWQRAALWLKNPLFLNAVHREINRMNTISPTYYSLKRRLASILVFRSLFGNDHSTNLASEATAKTWQSGATRAVDAAPVNSPHSPKQLGW